MHARKNTRKAAALALLFSMTSVPVWAKEGPSSVETPPEDNPPWSMADEYFGAEAMANARETVQTVHGDQTNVMVMADRFEVQITDDEETLLWDLQAWYGGDINKIYVKSEGDYAFSDNAVEDAEIQLLWSRAVSTFWDLQAGLRQDLEPQSRTHAVLGLQGLAPYWIEIDAAAFLSTDGDLSARVEAEYDVRITQQLIIQPRAELELSAQNVPEIETGSGVTALDLGLRLRYEIEPEFAPYIGAEWQQAFGRTADIIKASGEDANQIALIFGIRGWF